MDNKKTQGGATCDNNSSDLAAKAEVPSGWIALTYIKGELTSVAFRDVETAQACCAENAPVPFFLAAPAGTAVDIEAIHQIADELELEASAYEGDFADTVNGCADALRHLIDHGAAKAPAAQAVTARPSWKRADFIEQIVLGVAEIPDRDSPEGQPEMMLVTDEELRNIVQGALETADEYGGLEGAASPASTSEAAQADIRRYQRLRILGAAPAGTKQLGAGTVLRFQNLDDFVDADIAAYPSRGEAKAAHAQQPVAPEGQRKFIGYFATLKDEELQGALAPNLRYIRTDAQKLLNAAPTTAGAAETGEDARDAARYRYMRNEAWGCGKNAYSDVHVCQFGPGVLKSAITELAEDALDAAIDAAMRATQQEGE